VPAPPPPPPPPQQPPPSPPPPQRPQPRQPQQPLPVKKAAEQAEAVRDRMTPNLPGTRTAARAGAAPPPAVLPPASEESGGNTGQSSTTARKPRRIRPTSAVRNVRPQRKKSPVHRSDNGEQASLAITRLVMARHISSRLITGVSSCLVMARPVPSHPAP
jgi:hypothetical protein